MRHEMEIINSLSVLSYLGFYGRPWTMEQRKELFRRYSAILNNLVVIFSSSFGLWR